MFIRFAAMEKLLLLHGALGSKGSMKNLSENLSEKFDVDVLEFSAHGKTHLGNKSFGIPLFAEEIIDHIKANDNIDFHVFGYSMGGYAALYAATLIPRNIKSIFTLGTKFLWTNEYAENESRKLNASKILEKVPNFAAHLREMHSAEGWESVLQNTSDMMFELGKSNLLTAGTLNKIDIPVGIAVGELDNTVGIEESMIISKMILTSQFLMLANTQHPLEKIPLDLLEETYLNFMNSNF